MPRTKSANQNKETTRYSEKKRKSNELESNDTEFKTQPPKKLKMKNSELVSPVFIGKILSLPWDLHGEGDPGICVNWRSDAEIHDAMQEIPALNVGPPLGLPAGLALGVSPAASAANVRTWFQNFVLATRGVNALQHQVSQDAYHHLTPTQLGNITNRLNALPWGIACFLAENSIGTLYAIHGSGVGSCEILECISGPFRS